jgi:hypothetical protein
MVMITGATGVGKSTQVPKLYLYSLKMIDHNYNGKIACSVPRIMPVKNNAERWKLMDEKLTNSSELSANQLADLYIQLTDDLSYARTFYPQSNTTIYLNQLAARTHRKVYKNKRELYKILLHFLPLLVLYPRQRSTFVLFLRWK